MRLVVVSLTLLSLAFAAPVGAQTLDVPFSLPRADGRDGDCASSTVTGLNPQGDGFLAVRSGPGTNYRMLDKVFNGDVVFTCGRQGAWHGVLYRTRGTGSGPTDRQGWVHGNWLRDLAG